MSNYTTIRVSIDVRDILKDMGSKDEDYDNILRRVLKMPPREEETG